jgi:hypothetical protein
MYTETMSSKLRLPYFGIAQLKKPLQNTMNVDDLGI